MQECRSIHALHACVARIASPSSAGRAALTQPARPSRPIIVMVVVIVEIRLNTSTSNSINSNDPTSRTRETWIPGLESCVATLQLDRGSAALTTLKTILVRRMSGNECLNIHIDIYGGRHVNKTYNLIDTERPYRGLGERGVGLKQQQTNSNLNISMRGAQIPESWLILTQQSSPKVQSPEGLGTFGFPD